MPDKKPPPKGADPERNQPQQDDSFTGMPAKEGGGKETEQEKYREHDQ